MHFTTFPFTFKRFAAQTQASTVLHLTTDVAPDPRMAETRPVSQSFQNWSSMLRKSNATFEGAKGDSQAKILHSTNFGIEEFS